MDLVFINFHLNFLKYYSTKNGFINTEIFVANYDNQNEWFKLKDNLSSDININTSARLICLVRTEKKESKEIKDLFQFSLFNTENVINKKNNKKNYLLKFT